MATGNSSFTAAITRTLQNHGKEIFDAVSDNNAVFYLLQKQGNIKMSNGGRKFTHPIYYKENTSYKMYDPLEQIDTPVMDDYTRAEFDIKVGAGSLVISTVEVAKNAGDKVKLLDYGETVRMSAQVSMEQLMGDQMFATGSNAKHFGGIPFLVNSSPSTQTDVGGIDASATGNTYWRNIVGDAVSAFNTSNEGIAAMNKAELDATKGRRGPTVVVTTKANYRLYELSMTSNIRYMKTDLGDTHFKHLAFGAIPVIPDDNATTDVMYMLDLSSLWLQILSRGNFRTTPFQPSHDQLSETALMYILGNMTCGSRRTQVYLAVTG